MPSPRHYFDSPPVIGSGSATEGELYYRHKTTGVLTPVGGTFIAGRVPTAQADGSVAWADQTGGGGGGSGLPSLLGYAFANSSVTVNPHSSSDVTIDSLSAAFTTSGTRVVKITVSARATRANGGAFLTIYDGATKLAGTGGTVAGWSFTRGSLASAEAADNSLRVDATFLVSLASGSHTITARSAALVNNTQIVWLERALVVEALT